MIEKSLPWGTIPLLMLTLLAGCGGDDGPSRPAPEPEPAPPTLTVLSPAADSIHDDYILVAVQVTGTEQVTLSVNGVAAAPDSPDTLLWLLLDEDLRPGENHLRLEAVNDLGTASDERWAGFRTYAFPGGGNPCPDFSLPDSAGTVRRFSQLRQGQFTLLNFWASWCPPCRAEMPDLQAIADDFAGQGLVLLSVSTFEDPAVSQQYFAEQGFRWLNLFDQDDAVAGGYFGISGIPQTVLLDRDGILRRAYYGSITPATVRADIQELMQQ